MGFSNQERINQATKAIAGVLDANATGAWYDSQIANTPSILNKNVLTEFSQVPAAATVTEARTNVISKPTILQDFSQNISAIRLTPVTGTSNSTYIASSTHGNTAEQYRLRNWIHPTKVPRSTGQPSVGYTIRVFQGNPSTGGVEILSAQGMTGSGDTASPAWIFNYDQGLLLISTDFKATLSNPYILGFRYIGKTLEETLGQVGSGSGVVVQSSLIPIASSGSAVVDSADTLQYSEVTWDVVIETFDNKIRKLSVSAVHRKSDNLVRYAIYGSVGDQFNHSVIVKYNGAASLMELFVQNPYSGNIMVSTLRYPVKRI